MSSLNSDSTHTWSPWLSILLTPLLLLVMALAANAQALDAPLLCTPKQGAQVNVRADPSTESAIVAGIQPTQTVPGFDFDKNKAWVQVRVNNIEGWTSLAFVTCVTPTPTPTRVPPTATTAPRLTVTPMVTPTAIAVVPPTAALPQIPVWVLAWAGASGVAGLLLIGGIGFVLWRRKRPALNREWNKPQ